MRRMRVANDWKEDKEGKVPLLRTLAAGRGVGESTLSTFRSFPIAAAFPKALTREGSGKEARLKVSHFQPVQKGSRGHFSGPVALLSLLFYWQDYGVSEEIREIWNLSTLLISQ